MGRHHRVRAMYKSKCRALVLELHRIKRGAGQSIKPCDLTGAKNTSPLSFVGQVRDYEYVPTYPPLLLDKICSSANVFGFPDISQLCSCRSSSQTDVDLIPTLVRHRKLHLTLNPREKCPTSLD